MNSQVVRYFSYNSKGVRSASQNTHTDSTMGNWRINNYKKILLFMAFVCVFVCACDDKHYNNERLFSKVNDIRSVCFFDIYS